MCSLVMNLCSRDVITIHLNGSRLTGLTCSKAPGFWMVEHQLVMLISKLAMQYNKITGRFIGDAVGTIWKSYIGNAKGFKIYAIITH